MGSLTIYVGDIEDCGRINEIVQDLSTTTTTQHLHHTTRPSRVAVGTQLEGFFIEVSAIAALPTSKLKGSASMSARIVERLSNLTSAHVADGCVRTGSDVRIMDVVPIDRSMSVKGPACPVRHFGSVDIFLETIDVASPGQVLVIDNAGRTDEACIGDLIAIEAQAAGLGGIVVWGLHRDTLELINVGLPVFSTGSTPIGPRRLDKRDGDAFRSVRFGDFTVSESDWVIGDADGLVFVRNEDLAQVLESAESIRDAELRQAKGVRDGRSLRNQLNFDEYRRRAATNPSYTLRQHLIENGGAIET